MTHRPFGFPMHFKLEGYRAVPCKDLEEWALWYAQADRRVAETVIDDVRVSLSPCQL